MSYFASKASDTLTFVTSRLFSSKNSQLDVQREYQLEVRRRIRDFDRKIRMMKDEAKKLEVKLKKSVKEGNVTQAREISRQLSYTKSHFDPEVFASSKNNLTIPRVRLFAAAMSVKQTPDCSLLRDFAAAISSGKKPSELSTEFLIYGNEILVCENEDDDNEDGHNDAGWEDDELERRLEALKNGTVYARSPAPAGPPPFQIGRCSSCKREFFERDGYCPKCELSLALKK